MLNNSSELIIFNNNFIPRAELKTCQTTSCTIVYESVRLINGIPLFWEGHWIRLRNSLKEINSKIKLDKILLEQSIFRLIKQNALKNTNIQIEIFEENILVYRIHPEYPTTINYEQGVAVNYIESVRINPTRKILRPTWKKKMERKINEAGVYESLLVNPQGLITEGSHTNVFFIRENKLFSAEESLILPGITRLKILKIAEIENIKLEYAQLKRENVSTFDAAFLSATSLNLLPIVKINNQSFDVNNPILRILMNAFNKHLEQEIKKAAPIWKK
ncbi:MAG: aminotransferase class IV [Bacteroidales bacterium]|jgi:branched-chain amino acid aminotransferase|nr:aminotransferase class IV [Bacteroidales bacterium]